ncbi:PLP-dependent aminotransferase family protein [Paenibacillus profundus]|uniref:PLP-dependent aminotransferase family protein n=1 Tax=Paenibacillus profundus TaxID=1173085 RepID=A0ABS8YG25_9BACL|nr:PLP-dependent aminotransferase family protein [Paenibacillus profundus]MCE5170522.1 PLP-dependent aminotransferase family protein [Paenibacillus profundus]
MYKYLSLLNDLEHWIQSGEYKEGDKLPSIRMLAEQYRCSKSTIIRALDELEQRHMVYSVAKSGYYVMKRKQPRRHSDRSTVDFASSAPDPEVFPYLDFQQCINKAIDIYKNELFVYGTRQGLPSLIKVIEKQLANYQVFTSADHIYITSGIQQALALLTTIPFPNGKDTILIEQPGYHLYIEYVETHNVPVLGIERTSEGIDLQELERLFQTQRIKFFYTMPRFHNPLGTSYSQQQKKTIAKLAERYDVYIVEDDYLADLDRDAKADPIYAYDRSAHVIYLKSYSKIIFPGLRVGAAVIPPSIAEPFHKYKKLLDVDSSMLSQAALEIYIKNGMFERHKQKIRSAYSSRTERLTSALEEAQRQSKGLYRYTPAGNPCIHTYMSLDKRVQGQELMARLKRQSILVDMAEANYLSSFPKSSLLKLNVSNVKIEDIERGIERVMLEINKYDKETL